MVRASSSMSRRPRKPSTLVILVRVEEPAGGAERQHRPRELGDGHLGALDVAVALEEAWRYVASPCLDNLGLVPDRMARIGPYIRYPRALHGDAHVRKDLARCDANQRPAADDQRSGELTHGGRRQLPGHLVQRRPLEVRHPTSFLAAWAAPPIYAGSPADYQRASFPFPPSRDGRAILDPSVGRCGLLCQARTPVPWPGVRRLSRPPCGLCP